MRKFVPNREAVFSSPLLFDTSLLSLADRKVLHIFSTVDILFGGIHLNRHSA